MILGLSGLTAAGFGFVLRAFGLYPDISGPVKRSFHEQGYRKLLGRAVIYVCLT